jgi:DNA-binding transcriptional LysR family regulator
MYEMQLPLRRLALVPPPPAVDVAVFWHAEHSMDTFLMWMVNHIAQIAARLGSWAPAAVIS